MKQNDLYWLAIVALIAVGGGAALMHTRGFRNNNPGNLKAGTPWKGAVGMDSKGFAVFDTMENGVRALGKDLTAKINRGLDTVRKILYVYAPPSDNNPTATYVEKVSEWAGVHPDEPLEARHIPDVMDAIIRFENGKRLDRRTINAGIIAMAA